jgi:hypothetical protein
MADFKFTCPQCQQHIQCDVSYVGSSINCPTCRQGIVVPPVSQPPTAPRERTVQIKVATLRKVALAGLCLVLVAGGAAIVFYCVGNTEKTISTEWSVLDGNDNQWSLAGRKIHAHSTTGEAILASNRKYGDVTYSATVSTTNREATLAIRLQDAGDGYLVLFAPAHTPAPWNKTGFIAIVKKAGGTETTLAVYQRIYTLGQTAKIEVIARGPNLQVLLNETKIMQTSDSAYATGFIGLRIYGGEDYPCDATFSSIAFH